MRGFTLIETLMVIVVFGLVWGAISAFIWMIYKTYGFTWQQAVAIDEARKGIETMVKEIREARFGDDGSYPIEKAADKEFIFYSDIDQDGDTERVRYYLGTASSGKLTQECETYTDGGSCSVTFSNFLSGSLTSAQVKVSVRGDFGRSNEYAEIYADGIKLGRVCQTGCSDCPGIWQGDMIFDVTNQAQDNFIQFVADASWRVNDICPHAMKAKFEFSWTEDLGTGATEFKKGVINPTGDPITYPEDQEQIFILSSYVRNVPPIFEYFDATGSKIEDYPARLKDTKMMRLYLVIDVNPNRFPDPFELESTVQLRNLKTE